MDARDVRFFHGQNVYIGQRAPITRFYLLSFFLCFFAVRGDVRSVSDTCSDTPQLKLRVNYLMSSIHW